MYLVGMTDLNPTAAQLLLEVAITAAHSDARLTAEISFGEHGADRVGLEVDEQLGQRAFMRREIAASLPTLNDEYLVAINWTSAFWSRIVELIEEKES
jgi:hypothetical protein